MSVPLHNAVRSGVEQEVVHQLQRLGQTLTSHDLHVALSEAVSKRHHGIVQVLLDWGAPVTTTHDNCDSPIHGAARRGFDDVIELLITRGADVNTPGYGGVTPLLNAILNAHTSTVRLLLRQGANPNAADASGLTPMDATSRVEHCEIRELLRKAAGT